jgi:hypothetical protein
VRKQREMMADIEQQRRQLEAEEKEIELAIQLNSCVISSLLLGLWMIDFSRRASKKSKK